MDHLDKAREQVVVALEKLEEAVEAAMLAQAPSSDIIQVQTGLRTFREGLLDALTILDLAEASIERMKRNRS